MLAGEGRGRRPKPGAKAKKMGERIRQVRMEKLKLKQSALAAELGISHGTISHWERGGHAKPGNLEKFAKLSGVSLQWLMTGEETADFHPEWKLLEQRMRSRRPEELDQLFEFFNRALDLRETEITDRQKRQGALEQVPHSTRIDHGTGEASGRLRKDRDHQRIVGRRRVR